MASFKVLAAAVCLLVSVVRAMPGGHAESYLVSNLESGRGYSGGYSSGGYSSGGYSSGGYSSGGYSSGGSSSGGYSSGGSSSGGYSSGGSSSGGSSSGGYSSGGYSSGGSLGGQSGGYKEETYADHHPKYSFKYGVEDKHTGDYKDQQEERDGDVVKGEYSLLQPDGRKRIVHYTASKHGGFNAQVSYSGHAIHPEYSQKSYHL